MNHYCTYFDRGFLAQGLALWRSLARHDPDSVLWVLALDEFTAEVLREVGGTWLRVVPLAEMEAGDAALAAAKANRSRVEYYFTLSPCWPRWLLAKHGARRLGDGGAGAGGGIDRVTYVDADLFFFANPEGIFAAMDAARASVLVTGHRFPPWLQHYERHGKFNVGVLSFRNDAAGRGGLESWREECLDWCFDRLEEGKYADQKYLDAWPERLGAALLVLEHRGVNSAPWNWAGSVIELAGEGGEAAPGESNRRVGVNALHLSEKTRGVLVGGEPLVLFHFARFRAGRGDRWWHSGQLEYGVMPRRLRRAIYGPYLRALFAARAEIRERRPGFDFVRRGARGGREFWREWPWRLGFGGEWLRCGGEFFNLRAGLGRWSGRVRAALRRWRG